MIKKELLVLFFGLVSFCASASVSLIPTPLYLEEKEGTCTLPATITVNADKAFAGAAQYFAHMVGGSAIISFVESDDATLTISLDKSLKTSCYTFDSSENGVRITAGDNSGAVAGIATLIQLMPSSAVGRSMMAKAMTIPCVSISDEPRYRWRGMMLDISRHFHDMDEVKQLLDVMALYKMSRFHWHLVDNEGWRIEIKKYPRLTEEGAWRKDCWFDQECSKREELWDAPEMALPEKRFKVIDGERFYGGFFTQEQIREVVEYATARGIEVIPEIDMPGHFLTASSIYHLGCQGEAGHAICPGRDDVMQFCKDVFSEIFELFPSKIIYIGGDEVDKTPWKTCPDCQRRMEEEEIPSVQKLQSWFMRQMEVFFRSNGRYLMGWDEITYDGLSSDACIAYWRSKATDGIGGEGDANVLSAATSRGMRTMCCPTSCMYFDYGQDLGCMDNILNYEPLEGLNEDQQRLVLGLQANIWCEFIPSFERVWYQITPRMLALAENAWAAPERKMKTSAEVVERLADHYRRFDRLGIWYKIPELQNYQAETHFTGSTKLAPVCPYSEAVIRYTMDGSMPTAKSPVLRKPLTIKKSCTVRMRTFRPNGTPSDTFEAKFIKD